MDLIISPQLSALSLALVAVALLYFFAQQHALSTRREVLKRTHGCQPALWHRDQRGPFRYFGLDILIINAKRMREHRYLSNIQKRFKDFGVNTFQGNLGGVPFFLTLEPDNLKAIQSTQHEIWSLGDRRRWAFNFMLGEGIFSTDGKQWQHSRDMLRPSFVRAQNDETANKFEHHVRNLVRLIPTGGHMVDLSPLFHALTLDTSTELLFGESASMLVQDGPGKQLGDSFARGQAAIMKRAQFGRVGTALLMREDSRVETDFKFVQQFADRYVDQALLRKDAIRARTDKPVRYVFLEELVRQSDDRVRIRSELLNILVAGRDTTASLLTNLFWVMSRRPDIWAKLQEEITTSIDPTSLPSFDELKSMKYLKALISETLRLYPVVPFNTRQATQDTVLPRGGGPDEISPILIPKGTFVAWSVYAMHRRTDLFGPDAEVFRPERWLDDPATGAIGLRTSWEYLPFNGGARVCLGQNYALIEASYVTVRLCQIFSDIEPVDTHEPWTELISLTCVNKFGAKVVLTGTHRD